MDRGRGMPRSPESVGPVEIDTFKLGSPTYPNQLPAQLSGMQPIEIAQTGAERIDRQTLMPSHGGDHHVDRSVSAGVDRQPRPLGVQLNGERVELSWIRTRTITGDRALRPTRWSEGDARSLANCRLHRD